MGRDPNRARVTKDDYKTILELLKELGMEGRPSTSKLRIDVWKGSLYLGVFAWITKQGWRLTIVSPNIRTHQDLELGLERLEEASAVCPAANLAWEKFSKDRSEENWQAYVGILAAHDLRQFRA